MIRSQLATYCSFCFLDRNIFCSRRGFTTTQLSGLFVTRHSSRIALQFEWSPARAIHRFARSIGSRDPSACFSSPGSNLAVLLWQNEKPRLSLWRYPGQASRIRPEPPVCFSRFSQRLSHSTRARWKHLVCGLREAIYGSDQSVLRATATRCHSNRFEVKKRAKMLRDNRDEQDSLSFVLA